MIHLALTIAAALFLLYIGGMILGGIFACIGDAFAPPLETDDDRERAALAADRHLPPEERLRRAADRMKAREWAERINNPDLHWRDQCGL